LIYNDLRFLLAGHGPFRGPFLTALSQELPRPAPFAPRS